MRISDWSSDVCSSDLKEGSYRLAVLQQHAAAVGQILHPGQQFYKGRRHAVQRLFVRLGRGPVALDRPTRLGNPQLPQGAEMLLPTIGRIGVGNLVIRANTLMPRKTRSEEQTSELQTL